MKNKYPMTIDEYYDNMTKKYAWLLECDKKSISLKARYTKAKYVFDCINKMTKQYTWLLESDKKSISLNKPYTNTKYNSLIWKFEDKDFGVLTKPEDAFEIWWDV